MPQTLNYWLRQYEVIEGMRDGVISNERAHLKDLEREIKELRKANKTLKLASAFLPIRSSTADSSPEGFC